MPATFWIGFVCGGAVCGAIGFLIGRVMNASGAAETAAAKVEAADAKADEAREAVEQDLKAVIDETMKAGGKELEDALNNDFSLPPNHPLREPPKR